MLTRLTSMIVLAVLCCSVVVFSAEKGPKLKPLAPGATFIADQQIAFTVKKMPKSTLQVKVISLNGNNDVLQDFEIKSEKVTLKKQPNGLYVLQLLKDGKVIDKHNFAVVSPPPPPAKDLEKEWIGMCTHLERRKLGGKELNTELALLKLLGIHWVRMNCNWSWYHTGPGKFDEKQIDKAVKLCARLKKENIKPFWSIQNNPKWVSCAPQNVPHAYKFPPKGEEWKHWDEFAQKFTSSLKGVCNDYEIWCEPYAFMSITGREEFFPGGLNEAVATYGKRAYEAMHKVGNPEVYGPSNTHVDYMMIKQLLRDYGLLWDKISLHYAQWPLEGKSKTQMVRRWIREYAKKDVPIVYSESGVMSSIPKFTGKGFEPLGMEHSIEQFFMFWAEGIAVRHFPWVFRNRRLNGWKGGKFYNTRFEPSKEVVYLQSMMHFTRNADFAGFLDLPDIGFKGCLALQDGHFNAVVWISRVGGKLPDALVSGKTIIKDRNNNIIKNMNGKKLVYLYDVNTNCQIIRDNLIQIQPYGLMVTDKVDEDARIILNNPGKKSVTYKLKLKNSSVKVDPGQIEVTVAPASCKVIPVTVSASSKVSTFITEPLEGLVNGKKIQLGNIYRFDESCLKSIRVDNFDNKNSWRKTSRTFDHAARGDSNANKSTLTIKEDFATARVVFDKPNKPKWLGMYFEKKSPVKIPGIPTSIKYKLRLDLKKLPNNLSMLSRFRDSTGQILLYKINPRQFPRENDTFREYSGFIDSPVNGIKPHSKWGGANDGIPHYPLKFCGFSFNMDPEVIFPENGTWVGEVDIKDIEVEYYLP